MGKEPVRGFTLFEGVKNEQVGAIYEEFNSIAFGIDVGGMYTPRKSG